MTKPSSKHHNPPKTILVAIKEAAVMADVNRAAEGPHCRLYAVADLATALTALATEAPAAAILDIDAHSLEVPRLITELRRRTTRTPIILLASHRSSDEAIVIKHVDFLMIKPISCRLVEITLRRLLDEPVKARTWRLQGQLATQ